MKLSIHRLPRAAAATFAFALALGATPLPAQDLQELYFKATELATKRQFAEAIAVYDEAIGNLGEFAWEDYGPVFGGIYYDKGICHIQLKQFPEAVAALTSCHEDFPPADKVPYGNRKEKPKVVSPNMRWEMAVFQLALANQQMENYQGSLDALEKFLGLKPDPAVVKPIMSPLVLIKGKSLIGLGKLDEGVAELTRLFTEYQTLRPTGKLMFQGMLEICNGWISSAAKGGDTEAIASQANAFFDTYAQLFTIPAYDKAALGFVDRLRLLGQQAQQAGLNVISLRAFAMVPTTQDILADIKARSEAGRPEAYQADLAKYTELLESTDPPELENLRLIARAWEGLGNRRAGYVINRRLYDMYPDSKALPEILHEAARYSFALGDANASQYYGEKFMDQFPNHELQDNVATFMLQSLLRTRKYDVCLDVSGRLRDNFQPGDASRDLADFVYGASLYYLNRQDEAEPELALHVDKYPESQFRESSRFFQASNKIIRGKFKEAAPLLDSFLKDYPDSAFAAQALFDRATAYYIADDYLSSMQRLDEIFTAHQSSNILGRAQVLKGDVQRAMAQLPAEGKDETDYWKDAQQSYLTAKETLERLGQKEALGESLFKILEISIDLEDWDNSVAAYDEFLPEHVGSHYEPQLSVFAMPALQQVGRTDEGLAQLEKVIMELAAGDNVELLAEAIGSYQTFSLEHRGADATLATYDRLIKAGSPTLQTQLLIHKIIVYGEEMKLLPKEDKAGRDKLKNNIDQVFQKLKDYDLAILSDIALKAIGEHLEKQNPYEAMPFFQELLDRGGDRYAAPAEMALGRIEMGPPPKPNALERFKRVIEKYQDPKYEAEELIPEAHVLIGKYAILTENWDLGEEYLVKYINKKRWDQARKIRRAEAQYYYGYCLEQNGKLNEAIKIYNSTFAAYPAYPQWSAKAVERGFHLGYSRDDYPSAEAQRKGKMDSYEYLRIVLYSWQKIARGESDALDRLRLLREKVEVEMGLSSEEIEEIELRRNLKKQR